MNSQNIFIIYIVCELFELFLTQKGANISSYVENMLSLYKRGIIKFLCMHPSFYLCLLAVIFFKNYSFLAIILLSFKALDIALKLILLQKMENAEPLGVFSQMLEKDMELPFALKAGVCVFYVVIFYIAFAPYS